jgi:thiol:disulfide interchange protein
VLLALAAFFLVARIATGVHEAWSPSRPGGLVRWTSPAEVESLPAGSTKPILYDFSASWCVPCKQMDGELFSNAAAADFINNTFIPVRVTDEDQSPASVALRRRHHVDALPTVVVVHPGTTEPQRMQGYPGKRRAMEFLRLAAAGKTAF